MATATDLADLVGRLFPDEFGDFLDALARTAGPDWEEFAAKVIICEDARDLLADLTIRAKPRSGGAQ